MILWCCCPSAQLSTGFGGQLGCSLWCRIATRSEPPLGDDMAPSPASGNASFLDSFSSKPLLQARDGTPAVDGTRRAARLSLCGITSFIVLVVVWRHGQPPSPVPATRAPRLMAAATMACAGRPSLFNYPLPSHFRFSDPLTERGAGPPLAGLDDLPGTVLSLIHI